MTDPEVTTDCESPDHVAFDESAGLERLLDRTAPPLRIGTLTIHGDRAKLFGALAKAQAGYQPIPRSRTVTVRPREGNPYTFDYAPLEEVLTATLPSLNANGLALLSVMGDPGEENAETELHTLLTHDSGAFIHTCERLPPVSKAQDRGSQVTYRRRYQTGCLTGTSPEVDDDANSADGNAVTGVTNKGPRRTPPAPTPRQEAPKPKSEEHPHAPPAREAATANMSPEQKATFMGPTVFSDAPVEAVPERSIVNDEPMTEDMVMKIRAGFVELKMGGPAATSLVQQITGKRREECSMADGALILGELDKRLATKRQEARG